MPKQKFPRSLCRGKALWRGGVSTRFASHHRYLSFVPRVRERRFADIEQPERNFPLFFLSSFVSSLRTKAKRSIRDRRLTEGSRVHHRRFRNETTDYLWNKRRKGRRRRWLAEILRETSGFATSRLRSRRSLWFPSKSSNFRIFVKKKKKKIERTEKGSCNPIAILVCTTAPANNRVYGEKRGKERKKKKGASYARQKGKLYRRCNM